MKKGFKLFALAFALLFAVVVKVNADEVVVTDEATLKTCVATESNVCKLNGNIVLTDAVEIGTEVTIDLNGYSITPSATFPTDSLIIVLHGGTLTVNDSKGTGKISTTDADPDVIVGIKMTKAGGDDTKQATLIVNAGTIEGYDYGISGNGNPGRGNTLVTVNGGTVKSLSNSGVGIYQPQEGAVLVSGGKVIGASGIEMRSGTLLVTGGTIEATAAFSSTASGNGSTTTGVGIAVAQHTTAKELVIAITGGTIKGEKSLYQSNIQNLDKAALDKVQMGVIGGAFEGDVQSENFEEFIAGGSYNTAVDASYIAGESDTEQGNNGILVVKTPWDIVVKETENGTVTTPKTAYPGDTVKLDIKANKGYKVASIKVVDDLFGEEITVTDNSFVMPVSSVSVEVTFEKEEVVPNTGDNVVTFILIGLMSLVAFGYSANKLRKNA